MDDGVSVELVDCGDDALLEFLFRCDADVAQDGAGKLGKEALDEIEPGAVLGREGEFEAANSKRPAGCSASQALVSLGNGARNDCRGSA